MSWFFLVIYGSLRIELHEDGPKKKKKKKKNPKGTTSGTKRSEVPMMRNLTKRLMIRPYA